MKDNDPQEPETAALLDDLRELADETGRGDKPWAADVARRAIDALTRVQQARAKESVGRICPQDGSVCWDTCTEGYCQGVVDGKAMAESTDEARAPRVQEPGWQLIFHDADKEVPPDTGDKRKLVWLEDYDGMAWWGIRVHVTRNEWFNNSQPEMARIKLWADLPPHGRLLPASLRSPEPRQGTDTAVRCSCVGTGPDCDWVWESVRRCPVHGPDAVTRTGEREP